MSKAAASSSASNNAQQPALNNSRPPTPASALFALTQEHRATLVKSLEITLDKLCSLQLPPSKKGFDLRDPFTLYLGLNGIFMAVVAGAVALSAAKCKPLRELFSLGGDAHSVTKFINDMLHNNIDFIANKKADLRKDSHTLLFSNYVGGIVALDAAIREKSVLDSILTVNNRAGLQSLVAAGGVVQYFTTVYCGNDELFFGTDDCEPFYGKTGLIAAALTLRRSAVTREQQQQIAGLTSRLTDLCIASGMSQSNATFQGKPRVVFRWHGTAYVGAAHGTAGVLYYATAATASLGQSDDHHQQQQQQREARLNQIATLLLDVAAYARCPSGNYLPSISSRRPPIPQDTPLAQFCHGAPGLVLAFSKMIISAPASAASTLLLPQLLAHLTSAAEITWDRIICDSVGLCHGVSGNMYALLATSRAFHHLASVAACADKNKAPDSETAAATTTVNQTAQQQLKDQHNTATATLWWNRAVVFGLESARLADANIHVNCDHILSLFEGLAGSVAALAHLLLMGERKTFDGIGMIGYEV